MRTNLWNQFAGALGEAPTAVVRIISLDPDGRRSVVEYPNGSQTIVQGQSISVSDYAFVRNGEIIGPAPAVTPATLDV